MIVFIDDERRWISPYIEELEMAGKDVRVCWKIDDAFTLLEESAAEVEAVLLDIMMDIDSRYVEDEKADGGLRTGLLFLKTVLELVPAQRVILFTNYDLAQDDRDTCRRLGVEVFAKANVYPSDLIEILQQHGVEIS